MWVSHGGMDHSEEEQGWSHSDTLGQEKDFSVSLAMKQDHETVFVSHHDDAGMISEGFSDYQRDHDKQMV